MRDTIFEKSLSEVGSNRNLADSKVVDQIVRRFIGGLAEHEFEDEQQLLKYVHSYAEIFAGHNGSYHGNESWRNGGCRKALQVREHIASTNGLVGIYIEAFSKIADSFYSLAEQHSQGVPDEQVKDYVDRLIWYWTSMFFGTIDVLYPYARKWYDLPADKDERDLEDLQKSFVSGYYRKDGTYVKPHQDRRTKKYEPHVYSKNGWAPQGDKPSGLSPKGEELRGRFHAMIHPQKDDDGKDVIIHSQIPPSPEENWESGIRTAIATPACEMPEEINGIPVADWEPPETLNGWANVEGQIEMDEPPIQMKQGKGISTGIIIMEDDGRIWTVGPTNQFGGYIITFPKGRIEPGLPLQANAIKEVYEESGLKVEITGVLGDFERTTTVTRMYIGKRVSGNPANMGWESQFVALVPKNKISRFVKHQSDKPIVDLIEKL